MVLQMCVCVFVCGSSVHDKLVQFQACRGAWLIFVSLVLLLWPFLTSTTSSASFLVSPQIWIGTRASVRSPSDSAEIITVQPSPQARCYISPLIRLLRGVVDQLRSLYPDHSTTATPLFGDMINKRRGWGRNNTLICFWVLFVPFSSLLAPRLCCCPWGGSWSWHRREYGNLRCCDDLVQLISWKNKFPCTVLKLHL